jgi:hypothetical protein
MSDDGHQIPGEGAEPEETAIDIVLRVTAGDPRFVEAPPAGKAIVILGSRPPARRLDRKPGPG